MTKKKIVDLVSYSILLIHNDAVDGIMTEEQVDNMMKLLSETFDNDESKAIRFIQEKVKKLMVDLDSDTKD